MHQNPRAAGFRGCSFVLALLVFTAMPLAGQEKTMAHESGWKNLKYAIYFTHGEIVRLLNDPAAMRETMEYLGPIRPARVYLECATGTDINIPQMKDLAARFRALGIQPSGAMVPVGTDGPMCYNNPDQMAELERRARAVAGVYDEMIIDDWLFTTCTCEKCVAQRGSSSWADYRTKLLLTQSKKHIIDPAREVRPGIRIIIKYPNWYEGHRQNGYDVLNETRQFDAMAVGIETRTRAIHDQHIPIYSGYIFQKWWSGVDPSKWVGSWLDNYTMQGQDNDYVAQVWQAVLARTPEIILWSGGNLHHSGPFSDVYPHFREMLPEFDRAAGMLSGPSRGVPMYLPYGSTGEYNIFGFLGMAGIPLEPVGEFPAKTQNAFFTRHSLRDPDLAPKMLARLRDGHDVTMTWELFAELKNTEFGNALNLMGPEGSVSSAVFRTRIGWSDEIIKADRPFAFPRVATTTWPYVRDVAVVREDNEFGVLLSVKYLNGTLHVLNTPENTYDLLRLPPAALTMIRRNLSTGLGVHLAGPGGVALYLFGDRQYVLYNMNDTPVTAGLRFDATIQGQGWRELLHGRIPAVAVAQPPEQPGQAPAKTPASEVTVPLEPFEIAIIEAP